MPDHKTILDSILNTSTSLAATNGGDEATKASLSQQAKQHQQQTQDGKLVEIPLGDFKNISRLHAKIAYNYKKKTFELYVLGKNGARVDGKFYPRNSEAVPLHNGAEIQLGDAFLVFSLPTQAKRSEQTQGQATAAAAGQNATAMQNAQDTGVMILPSGTTVPAVAGVPPASYAFQEGKAAAAALGTAGDDMSDDEGDGTEKKRRGRPPAALKEGGEAAALALGHGKPVDSYAVIIAQTMQDNPDTYFTLQDIYNQVMERYPYFQYVEVGWRSSVRHALSTNKVFKRFDQENSKKAVYQLNPDAQEEIKELFEAAERRRREKEAKKRKQESKMAEGADGEKPAKKYKKKKDREREAAAAAAASQKSATDQNQKQQLQQYFNYCVQLLLTAHVIQPEQVAPLTIQFQQNPEQMCANLQVQMAQLQQAMTAAIQQAGLSTDIGAALPHSMAGDAVAGAATADQFLLQLQQMQQQPQNPQ